jgi:hypothetical protein
MVNIVFCMQYFRQQPLRQRKGGDCNIMQIAVKSKKVKIMQGKVFIVLAPHYYVS